MIRYRALCALAVLMSAAVLIPDCLTAQTNTGGAGNAISLQGVPISPSAPGNGTCLVYSSVSGQWSASSCSGSASTAWANLTAGTNSGGGNFIVGTGSTITFTGGAINASEIQGQAWSATAPTNGQCPVYNSTNSDWEPGTCGGGSMVYPGAGIPNSTGSAWGTSYSTTGSGNVVLSTSPSLTTPNLGTPSAATLTNATGLPVGGISATGTPSSTTYLRGDGSWSTPSATAGVTSWAWDGWGPFTGVTEFVSGPGLNSQAAPSSGNGIQLNLNQASTSLFGGVTLGGSLGGTYNSQTVLGLDFASGATHIALGAAPTSGQCLEYNGTNITGAACSGGGSPGGSTYAIQYNAGSSTFGGVGPGTSGDVFVSQGSGSAPLAELLPIASISATGTPSSTTYLRGDGTWSTVSGGSSAWSSLTDPTANLSLGMAAYSTTFTWGAATGASDMMALTDTASNTGTGYVLNVSTGASSAATPLKVQAGTGTTTDVADFFKGATNELYIDQFGTSHAEALQVIGGTITSGAANLTLTGPSGGAVSIYPRPLQFSINAIAYSLAPALDLNSGNLQQFACTTAGAAVTPTFTGFKAGEVFTVIFVQNGTTACTWTWPATIHGAGTVSATLSSVNVQQFVVSNNGTDAYAVSTLQTSSGGTP